MLVAQQSTKNISSKVNGQLTNKKVRKNTYADDEIRLAKMTKTVTDKIHSINELMRKKYDLLNKLSDSSVKNKVQQDIDSLFKIDEQLESQLTTVRFYFIRNNRSSFLSLDGLTMILSNSAELPLYDTVKSLFNNLNKNIQNSATGRKFKLMLVNKKNSEVGSVAPDFKVRDIDNKEISLSDFRNKKFVLLDFWASWCKPCREDMPIMKKIYKVYREKDLEIIGISKDDNLSLWKKAIIQDSIGIWRHISVPLNIQSIDSSAITNKYFVYGIPVKILINREGIIIGRWTGSGEENIAELKNILNNVFDK
jgi:thiol-disulfide isomerase/thioredoxin